MTTTYKLEGMTCGSCEQKVTDMLTSLSQIDSAVVNRLTDSATIIYQNGKPTIEELISVLGGQNSKYQIGLIEDEFKKNTSIVEQDSRSWLATYKPILLIFAFITGVTMIVQWKNETFDLMQAMTHFMAGFFLVFSFFKLLNIKEFAISFSMYDIIAQRFYTWGYIYPFVELGLGILFLMNLWLFEANLIAFTVMTLGIIGVLQSVFSKRKIKCACLGSVFNLPMSTVTIIEDGLMIVMSLYMLLNI